MESKKINQLATEMSPAASDLTIIGDPITGVSKKVTLEQISSLFAGAVSFYTNYASFPPSGVIDTIYCAKDTQKLYLWSGSAYVEVFPSQALLNTYQLKSEKGNANGYASLDSGGKVPISQLPSSIMEYKGTWSAATNTPTLANGTGDTGDVYICNAAGSVNFGAGAITFAVGDYVIYSGSIWQRSSGAVGTVTSVGLSSSTSGVTIGSSPITTSGTITLAIDTASGSQNGLLSSTDWSTFNNKENAITAGTTAQYYRGDKTFQTLNTTAVVEGTNLYYTEARVNANTNVAANTAARHNAVTIGTANGLSLSTQVLSLALASTSATGALSSTDWNTFNNKQSALTIGNIASGNTTYVSVTGGTGAIIGSGVSINVIPQSIVQYGLTLTTTGTSGASTFVGSTLNVPTYTLAGLGGQPLATNLTSLAGLTYASTSFVKMTAAGTFSLDTNTYALASALGNYLPLAGGTLTGDLLLTKASIPKIEVNATDTSSYSYFGNQENGTLRTYFLYLNSLWSDTERRNNLEIRNQNGPITFWANASKALTIANSGAATFLGTISATNLSGTNTGDQTLAGLGGVPTSRTLTINGVGYDLSADRSWTITAGVTGSGTQNKLTKWNNAGGTTIGDSIITATTTDVTITSTLVGPMFVLEQLTANAYSQMQFKGDTLSAYIFKANSTYTSYGGPNSLNFYTDALGGGFSFNPRAAENAVLIDALGNLGIGVGATVGAKLDIAGGNARITSTQNGFGGISAINPSIGTSAYSGLLVGNNLVTTGGGFLMLGGNFPTTGPYTSNGVYAFGNQAGGLTLAAEAGTLKFVTGATIKATMIADGNLGLNETAPTNLLHLAGNVATPSLRLASTSTGFYWDIGRENATTGDFVFNYKTPSTSSTEWVRITTLGLFGIGVTPSGTYGKLTVAGGIRTTADSLSKLEIGRYNAGNPDSYIKLGSTSNGLIISNAADSADLFYLKNSGRFGIGTSPSTIFDVSGSAAGAALSYMKNTETTGYSGIDIYRQNGTHAGSVWCANDTAGATNNRNALTIAARAANEKVIIVGGGYDPTVTGGLTVAGPIAKLEGNNPHHNINATAGLYAYVHLNNQASAGNDRNAYFIQNTAGQTSNGVAAGAAYLYFGQTQNMEFVWAGLSRIQFNSAGAITAQGGFFDTSDSRLKILVKDYEQPKGIQNVPARMYVKNSKQELGYYAQDLQEILPSAVGERADGFLTLSYSQVHTAKISYLEDKVAQLEELIKSLIK